MQPATCEIWREFTPATPDDVRAVAFPVLRHRIVTNFNAEAEGIRPDDIVKKLVGLIPPDGNVNRLLPKVFKTA